MGAYRAALEVYTREHTPLNWAWTQSNLGIGLVALGECGGDTARLDQAVEAHHAALAVFTVKDLPHYHKFTNNSLQCALLKLRELRDELESTTASD